MDRNVKSKAPNIFAYQSGKTTRVNNSFIRDHDDSLFEPGNTGLYKRKSINNPDQKAYPLWEDGTGNPVLTWSAKGEHSEYKFYSHFDPEWNDLVWHPRFPEALLGMIFDKENQNLAWNLDDRRTLPLAQIIPAGTHETAKKPEQFQLKETKFDKPLWILFVLLLALERWVSHKKRSITANG
ncbi:MAG TPA: hypothetical protein VLZ28_01000, partial [Daejeonella sp.]|nr:hypothetical protein [Daejeonella sp.]